MVTLEPDLEQIFELAIFRDVLRREMAVVIQYRLGLGKLMVKAARGARLQEKPVVNEFHALRVAARAGWTDWFRSSSRPATNSGLIWRSKRFSVTFFAT